MGMRMGTAGTVCGVVPLLGAHLAPLPLQRLTLFRRHAAKAPERFAHALLLVRRQTLELLPALPQLLALLGRH